MTFGTANLGAKVRGRPTRLKTYDCGKYGRLPASSIARIAGIQICSVKERIERGIKGEALCAPKLHPNASRKHKGVCYSPGMIVACRLALAFPDRLPSYREILEVQPMSVNRAQRWRQALRDAREAA